MLQLNIKRANIKLVMGVETLIKCRRHPAIMAFCVFNKIYFQEFHYDGRALNKVVIPNKAGLSFYGFSNLPSPYITLIRRKVNKMKLTTQHIDSLISKYNKTQTYKLKPDFIKFLKSKKGISTFSDFLKLNNNAMFVINVMSNLFDANPKFNLPVTNQPKEKTMFNEITMFEQTQMKVIYLDGERKTRYFTAQNIGEALGYSEPRIAIVKLYNSNRSDFEELSNSKGVTEAVTPPVTQVILPTAGGAQNVTVFSTEAALLIAMLSKTEIATKFRIWLLKLIQNHKQATSTNEDLENKLQNVNNANALNFNNTELKRALKIGDKRLRRYKKELSSIGVNNNKSKQLALI